MLTRFALVLFLTIGFVAQAGAAQDLQCSELVSRLSPVNSYRGDKIPTVAEKRVAIEALKEIPPDRYSSVPEIRKSIQSDYAAALLKYYSSRRDCETTRMHLIKMLMKFATTPKLASRDRVATVELIRTELARPTFPSPQTTRLKIETLAEAFAQKIFESSASKEPLASLKKAQDAEGEKLNSLSNNIQPELSVNLEKSSLDEVRTEFGKAKNKKKVEELREYQLAELESVEKLEALYSKVLAGAR
jgi:hypothetical protein